VQRQRENHTITSSVSPAAARRVVRAHIRSPLVGLLWTAGLAEGDMVVGVILGNHLYARPFPRDSAQGRINESLKLRGRIVRRTNGGSELRLSIFAPRGFRVIWRVMTWGIAAGCLAGYLASGESRLLPFVAVWAGLGLFGEVVRRTFRGIEPSERALLAAWVETVTADLRRGGP
jgi:hypothetical protein